MTRLGATVLLLTVADPAAAQDAGGGVPRPACVWGESDSSWEDTLLHLTTPDVPGSTSLAQKELRWHALLHGWARPFSLHLGFPDRFAAEVTVGCTWGVLDSMLASPGLQRGEVAAEVLVHLAKALERSGRADEAFALLDSALSRDPSGDPGSRLGEMGYHLAAVQGDWERAVDYHSRWTPRARFCVNGMTMEATEIHLARRLALVGLGRWGEASRPGPRLAFAHELDYGEVLVEAYRSPVLVDRRDGVMGQLVALEEPRPDTKRLARLQAIAGGPPQGVVLHLSELLEHRYDLECERALWMLGEDAVDPLLPPLEASAEGGAASWSDREWRLVGLLCSTGAPGVGALLERVTARTDDERALSNLETKRWFWELEEPVWTALTER